MSIGFARMRLVLAYNSNGSFQLFLDKIWLRSSVEKGLSVWILWHCYIYFWLFCRDLCWSLSPMVAISIYEASILELEQCADQNLLPDVCAWYLNCSRKSSWLIQRSRLRRKRKRKVTDEETRRLPPISNQGLHIRHAHWVVD